MNRIWLMLAVTSAAGTLPGCGGREKAAQKEPPPKEKPVFEKQLTIQTAPGEATARRPDGARERLYHVKWRSANLDISDQGILAGSMEGVSGAMFQDGKEASSFRGGRAKAERATMILRVEGGVRVSSSLHKATLTCDSVVWLPQAKLVKAIGHVRLEGEIGTLGVADEMWATPELSVIATPDMFKR